MNLHSSHSPAPRSFAGMRPPKMSSGIESVVLRHLKSAREIEAIMHLRGEIDLSAHTGRGSNFFSLEKKETSWGLFAHLNSTGTS
ncbi:MAG: hypothetical protein ACAH21_17985 [Ramlibacter sp.]|nr:hypothetical protein [Ramlibacter sp.]